MTDHQGPALDRRRFLRNVSGSTLGLAFSGPLATLVAACSPDDPTIDPGAAAPGTAVLDAVEEPQAVVGDVLDFALTSDDWAGDFGHITMRLHQAAVDGSDAWFIRTDASDEAYAAEQHLVVVPRLRALSDAGLTAAAYYFDEAADDQPVVLSTEPGRDDYTPAFEVHRVRWTGTPRVLRSLTEIEEAQDAGELEVDATGIVVNAPLVVWSGGQMPADDELLEYLGPGQLIGPPDLAAGQVTFKLHECYPESRYIVTDTSAPPMADGMNIASAPRLHGASDADATGRVNVLMGGPPGPGPMGFQPSVFDSRAGDPVWSPYWDHMVYVWDDGADGRLLETEQELHDARDAGELEEFVGTPDTGGEGFVVNCPVPVVAPNTFQA